jgi:hypothetical protein
MTPSTSKANSRLTVIRENAQRKLQKKRGSLSPHLILRSIAQQCVSKDGVATPLRQPGGLVLRDACLRFAQARSSA